MDPMNILFVLGRLNISLKKSLMFEKKVIKATAKIIPGMAYPETEKLVK